MQSPWEDGRERAPRTPNIYRWVGEEGGPARVTEEAQRELGGHRKPGRSSLRRKAWISLQYFRFSRREGGKVSLMPWA